jgi:hypothetical protein
VTDPSRSAGYQSHGKANLNFDEEKQATVPLIG